MNHHHMPFHNCVLIILLPSPPWLQLFLESHLDAAQLARVRQLWRDYLQRAFDARLRHGSAAMQVRGALMTAL